MMGMKQVIKEKVVEEEGIVLGWLVTNKVALIVNAVVFIVGIVIGYRVGH